MKKDVMNIMDNSNAKPLYMQIKEKIEHEINSGRLEPNHQIPSERELCEKYNVSRITVRQAIAEAEKDGLIYKIQGKGTFVKEPVINQGLDKLTSFSKTLFTKGLKGRSEIINIETIPVDFQLANILKCDMSGQIVNLKLLGLADDEPMVCYDSYFPYNIGMKIVEAAKQSIQRGEAFSTSDLYKKVNVLLGTIDQTFEAANCNEEMAKIMKVEEGRAIMLVTSIIYSRDNKPLEFRTAKYRADKYRFHIKRTRE